MKKALGILGLILVIAAGAWLIHHGSGTKAVSSENPIKIGAVLSLTGIAASYGEPARNAMQIAIDEINANGGIDGRPVSLTVEDDATTPATGISAFRKLVDADGIAGIVGGNFDFATIPLFPVADSEHVAFISPANLRIPGGLEPSGNSFVLMPDFSKVIVGLKPYLAQSPIQKLAVVHFKSTFGTQIATTLGATMTELDRGPIVDDAYTSIGNNDFRTTIIKLKQEGVDAVFLDMVDIDPVTFLTQARNLDYHPTVISYYGIIDSFGAPTADKTLLEGVVVLDWESSSARFQQLYQKRYGVLATHTAEKSYESIYVMAHAIAATKNLADVAPYLATHSFETPSGTVSFNKDHAIDTTPVKIEVVKDGNLIPLF
ncbi:MAG: ABC transporter substrate-binding protein [Patescibacteria group bacterium]